MATQSLYFLEKYHLLFEYLKYKYKQILTQDIYPFSIIFVSIVLINNKNNELPRTEIFPYVYFNTGQILPQNTSFLALKNLKKRQSFFALNILNNTSIAHPPILSNKQQK